MTQSEHVSRIRYLPDEDLAAVVMSMRRALTNSDRFCYTRKRDIAQEYETIDLKELDLRRV